MKTQRNAIRGVFVTAMMLFLTILLNTTPVQSAYPYAPNATTLTLTKTVKNDNGGDATQADFQAQIDGGDVAWDTPISITPDIQHTASENPGLTGYTPSVWGLPCAEDGTITLSADQSASCSITNDDIPPSLTITKLVVNNNGGTAVPTDWTLTASGPTTISGAGTATSDETFYAGIYTLSETLNPPGYTSGSWICTGGTQVGNEITLALGETASCTITSDDISPNLTVIKKVINKGGTLNPSDFTIHVTGTNVNPPSFPGADLPGTTVTLNPGVFSVSEDPVNEYEASLSPDCSGTIALGELKTCTITNNKIPSIKVTPVGGLETSENESTDSFTIVLSTMPTDLVTVVISSSDISEGSVDTDIINFNSTNWNIPRTVKVIGVDDFILDGDIDYFIRLDPKTSIDPDYSGLNIVQISATNLDAPSIEWIKPVKNSGVYFMDKFHPIVLEVGNPGNEPIYKAQISRWVPSANDWDTVAEFLPPLSPPYSITIYPDEFHPEWNELRTRAWSPPGDQRISSQPYILIYKGYGVFLPLVKK